MLLWERLSMPEGTAWASLGGASSTGGRMLAWSSHKLSLPPGRDEFLTPGTVGRSGQNILQYRPTRGSGTPGVRLAMLSDLSIVLLAS